MVAFALLRLHRLVLLVVLAVALTATGFAHRVAGPQDQAMAYALAMGAQPADFCGDGPDGGPGTAHCVACQITGTADLPSPSAQPVDLDLAYAAGLGAPPEVRVTLRVLDPAHGPQSPPSA